MNRGEMKYEVYNMVWLFSVKNQDQKSLLSILCITIFKKKLRLHKYWQPYIYYISHLQKNVRYIKGSFPLRLRKLY